MRVCRTVRLIKVMCEAENVIQAAKKWTKSTSGVSPLELLRERHAEEEIDVDLLKGLTGSLSEIYGGGFRKAFSFHPSVFPLPFSPSSTPLSSFCFYSLTH